MGNAGRVLMIPKGDYNAATTYEMLDCVYYNGRSYVCKQTSTGNAPTNTTYWQVMTPDSSAEIQALTNYVTDTGVKNLLPYPYLDNTKTVEGVTFTVNSDGSVTLNGTATGRADFVFFQSTVLKGFSGGILNGNSMPAAKATLFVQERGGSWTTYASAYDGNDAEISQIPNGTTVWVFLRVFTGAVFDNVTFYPMIRESVITDPTYQPYAKTNVELTQDVATLNDVTVTDVTSLFTGITSGVINMIKCGRIRQLQFDTVAFPSDATFPTLDVADRPKAFAFSSLTVTTDNTSSTIWIRVNGTFGSSNVIGKTVKGSITWIAS